MRFLVVLGLCAIVGAGAWFAFGPGATTPISSCEAADLEPPSSIEPTAEPPVIAWREGIVPHELRAPGEQFLTDVVAFGEGFVAVGVSRMGGDGRTVILQSPDGLAWTADAGMPAGLAETELWSFALAGERLFALGSTSTDDRGGSRAAVWSTVDGRSWTEATGPFAGAAPGGLAAGEEALLMIGTRNESGLPMAWRSDDGETWVEHPMDLPVPLANARFAAVAALGDGWHAVGSIGQGADGRSAAVVWRSDDGTSWSCHLLDSSGFGFAAAHELRQAGARWLAGGTLGEPCHDTASCVGHSVAWASDGLAWSEGLLAGPVGIGGTTVVGGRDGFVAVRHNFTAVSIDGFTWAAAEGGGPGNQPDGLAVSADGRVVAVGASHAGGDADGWLAIGELDR